MKKKENEKVNMNEISNEVDVSGIGFQVLRTLAKRN